MTPGDSNKARLSEMLSQCTAELLAELGVHAEQLTGDRQPTPTAESIAAFSGFGNNEIRGSFTFLGPSKLFARLHPLPPTVTPRDLTDWACELVNQSVGRFRNRLLAYGVRLALSLPQSALAEQLQLSSSLQPARIPISFGIDGMVLEGWFDLEIGTGFQLAEGPSDEEEIALREGSMVLF
jgi:hypothetical protein